MALNDEERQAAIDAAKRWPKNHGSDWAYNPETKFGYNREELEGLGIRFAKEHG